MSIRQKSNDIAGEATLDQSPIRPVQDALIAWFEANHRDLPWRRTRDPYRILVSEVMLQQTQVDRVIPYYVRFLERFPSLQVLADAPTAGVIQIWAGLGYNRRAVRLQQTAIAVQDEYGGVFPSDVSTLEKLPGIGAYTAGAIACFAFEQDVGFFDTNMKRVLHRIFAGPELPKARMTERQLQAIAERAVPEDRGWIWNQALIEFGAVHCTARKPACVVCPVQVHCRAHPAIQSIIAQLPPRTRVKNEGTFRGSNRFYRGRIISELRTTSGELVGLDELGARIRPGYSPAERSWLENLVHDLERDGLARVCEPTAAYDASDGQEMSVSLPVGTLRR